MKILIIDDNQDCRRSLSGLLTVFGHTVHLASDGLEGISMALSNPFELIITDFDMPVKNGHDVIREVLAVKPGTRIWLISGDLRNEVYSKAKKLGAEESLDKTNLREFLEKKGIVQ